MIPQPVALSLSSLLPPSIIDPGVYLPSPSFALLGPLPPTTPIHLALNYLALSELPEYEALSEGLKNPHRGQGSRKEASSVLVISSSRRAWTEDIIDEDEDWLREKGGEYGVTRRLKQIQFRACPTLEHLKLLLTLLSSGGESGRDAAVHLDQPPGLIILWDLGRLITHQVEEDENLPPHSDRRDKIGQWEVNHGMCLSDYMEIISAAKAAQGHFTSMSKSNFVTQLVILELHFDHLTSLPILKPLSDLRGKLATPQKERRVTIKNALEWALGDVVGVITEEDAEDTEVEKRYAVKVPNDVDVFHMRRRTSVWDRKARISTTRAGDGSGPGENP